jgi:phage baseplate assembly protein W
MAGISVALPLQMDENDGAYRLNKNLKDSVKQNFKMLLLTNPGERMMDPEFGIGLETFLFEPNDDSVQLEISSRIEEQVQRYMPFIEVVDTYIVPDGSPNSLHITISYDVLPIGEADIVTLSLSQNGADF